MKKYILTTMVFLMMSTQVMAAGRATQRDALTRETAQRMRELNERMQGPDAQRRERVRTFINDSPALKEVFERVGERQFMTYAFHAEYGTRYLETLLKIETAMKRASAEQGDVATQFKAMAEALGPLMAMERSVQGLDAMATETGVRRATLDLIFKSAGEGSSVVKQLTDGGMLDAALLRTAAENADLTSIYQSVANARTGKARALVDGLIEVVKRRLPEADRNNIDKINEKLEELVNQLRRCIS